MKGRVQQCYNNLGIKSTGTLKIAKFHVILARYRVIHIYSISHQVNKLLLEKHEMFGPLKGKQLHAKLCNLNTYQLRASLQ